MTTASAPGKIILLGEHAVVYGRPAIAVPVRQVSAIVEVEDSTQGKDGEIKLEAPDIQLDCWYHELNHDDPLARIVQLTLDEIQASDFHALCLRITSTIPIAAGLGSGTAVSVAIVRALSSHLATPIPLQRQSELVFEVEQLFHGTPSGIDNTVVTFNQPIFFIRGQVSETLAVPSPITFIIGDTGQASPTSLAVGKVRQAWQEQPSQYEVIFDKMSEVTKQARECIIENRVDELGSLMNKNQSLLEQLGVSTTDLNKLIEAARLGGAKGAKLSGAGLGGNMIALVDKEAVETVETALRQAGAVRIITTEVTP